MLHNKQKLMNMTKSTRSVLKPGQIVASSALALSLVACGDSGLEQLQEDRIEAAVNEVNEAEQLLAASPDSDIETADETELALGAATDSEIDTTDEDELSLGAAAPESDVDASAETEDSDAESEIDTDTTDETEVSLGEALPDPGIPVPSAATQDAIDVDEFELIFNDEFNATELDATKWNTTMAWGPNVIINDEQQFYVDTQTNPDVEFNPFSFDGESLIISADATPESMSTTSNGQEFVSGAVTTFGKFDMSYGYIEARVDVPEGAGLWPALWMLGSEFVDLKPQTFMMEFNGSNPDSFFHNYNYTDPEGNLRSPMQHEVVVDGASSGWHTIGLRWSVGELIYYVNGFPTFQVNGDNVASQAMYLIMNLAVGGVWVDAPDETTSLPAPFKVDYIRVYQRN